MRILACFLLAIIFCTGCTSLKQVTVFSNQSLDGIQKFEELGYGFKQHCLDRCLFDAMRKFEIKRELDCSCDGYQDADSVTQLIYQAIVDYFEGLQDLSNNELTAYDLAALKASLTEGTFGDLVIRKPEAEAYVNISQILLRASTDLYRKKKLKQYIEAANAPLQVLLEKFRFILTSNLENALDFKKERYYAYYKEMNLAANVTDYEKGKATIDYYGVLSAVSDKQKQLAALGEALETIAEGHQKLYENRGKLKAKELAVALRSYAGDIRSIVSEFNKLKHD